MATLDPEALRSFARRDWGAPERLARQERAAVPVSERVALGIALYEAVKTTRPDWPTEADRRADFDAHVRLKALMTKAADVGGR